MINDSIHSLFEQLLVVLQFAKMYSSSAKLALYRAIIKNAKLFPSIKRYKLLKEIRDGFRENRHETNIEKINLSISLAEKGLSQLKQYTLLQPDKTSWNVDLEKNPMPKDV
mmetsp:Transcript_8748/g.8845  ORF Transcript_8748/g.8845 Transcript_8748/m.8845 type:complete len:111 (+) Transcript_8748:121-453(+)